MSAFFPAWCPRLAHGSRLGDLNAEARYERFEKTLATIKRAGVTRLGFVGNDRFAAFDRPPR